MVCSPHRFQEWLAFALSLGGISSKPEEMQKFLNLILIQRIGHLQVLQVWLVQLLGLLLLVVLLLLTRFNISMAELKQSALNLPAGGASAGGASSAMILVCDQ